jgi:hypothetical protein
MTRFNRLVCPQAPVKQNRVRNTFLNHDLSSSCAPRCLWPSSVATEDVIDAATLAAEADAKNVVDAAGLLLSLCGRRQLTRRSTLGPDPTFEVYVHA